MSEYDRCPCEDDSDDLTCPEPRDLPIHGSDDLLRICPHDCPVDDCGQRHYVATGGLLRQRIEKGPDSAPVKEAAARDGSVSGTEAGQ